MNGEKRFRELTIDKRAIDEESRTVELAFSSETPYERSFGIEILRHDQDSVDLSRLLNGAPLLVNHDPDKVVGIVEQARVDEDRVGRAVVRFGKSAYAEEIWGDVRDQVRRLVSVGYTVEEMERAERNDEGLATFHVKNWVPVEISIVPLPADPSVGIGRSESSEEQEPVVEIKSDKEPKMNEDSTLTVEASPRIEVNESEVRKAEQKRSKELVALGAKYNCIDAAQKAIEDGKDAGQFSRWILENNLKTEEPTEVRQDDGDIGLNEKERESFSLVRAVNSYCNNGKFSDFENEVSEAAKKKYGRSNVDGLVIPTDVLNHSTRGLVDGTATAGGNTVATDLLGASFIDILRNASVIAQTGATQLDGLVGDVAIPRQTGAATASWTAEVPTLSSSDQAFDQVTMVPKQLSAMTEYSKQLLAQSSISIEQFVRNDLAQVIAIAQDLAAVSGSGSSNQPTGIVNTSGIGSVSAGTDGAYTLMVKLEEQVATDNALTGSLCYVGNANAAQKLKRTEIASNTAQFVLSNGQVNGYPFYMSNQMASAGSGATATTTMVFGNFSDLLIGNWAGIDVVVDPYTLAHKRQVRLVTSIFTDIAVRHPESFAKITDLKYNA